MLIYFLLLAYPAIFAFLNAGKDTPRSKQQILPMVGFWLLYNFISAIRDNTAGDWYTYDELTYFYSMMSLRQAMADTDIGFALVAWSSTRIGLGLYFSNLVCSAILSFGILRLAYRLPNPWVAIAAAVPYLLIVVGYGYIRQAVAIGFVVSAICDLQDRRYFLAAAQMALAMSFHLSSAMMIPILTFAVLPRNVWTILLLLASTALLASSIVNTDTVATYQAGYLDQAHYESSGAFVRILMNIVPAICFILLKNTLKISLTEMRIWQLMAWGSIAMFPALQLGVNSTVIDRIALYFLPIQVYAFGWLVSGVSGTGRVARLVTLGCIMYFAAVQLIWLFYADHAFLWVPFQSIFSDTIIPAALRGR